MHVMLLLWLCCEYLDPSIWFQKRFWKNPYHSSDFCLDFTWWACYIWH